jgi:hypothetical protein
MSGLAMFGLKDPSLLQFDKARFEPTNKSHLKELYDVEQAPCDTKYRDVLDPVKEDKFTARIFKSSSAIATAKSTDALSIFGRLYS